MDNIAEGQQIFYGTCIASDDPMMLGRIRVEPVFQNIEAFEKANQGFDPNSNDPNKNGPWSPKDPFVFLPFLPYFVNQVPKPGEQVMLFYFNRNFKKTRNKYYMLSTYSSPTTIKYEETASSQTQLSAGFVNSSINLPPIKNQDGTFKNENNSGVFAEPFDISLNGRDSADIIIKEDELLLRAGKHKKFSTGQIPDSDDTRAFLQLSKYYTDTTFGNVEKQTRLIENDIPIKYLVEYDVVNPENQFSAFTAIIYVYALRTDGRNYLTLTSNFGYNTELDLSGTTNGVSLIRMINLPIGLNLQDLSLQINQRLKEIITSPSIALLQPNLKPNEQFPFYYRPSKRLRDLTSKFISTNDLLSSGNMAQLMSLVKISSTDLTPGYSLVIDAKLSPQIPYRLQSETFVPSKANLNENTTALLGATTLYLLSNATTIPGKEKIDLQRTVYGIPKERIVDNIEPNTSSMVRGEELLELMELIVRFCLTHVHPYPLLPPSSVTLDGLSTDELLAKMQEAYQKILNSNIRIN